MYYGNSENVFIETLYAPGYSYLMMSNFRTYLTLKFVPCVGINKRGLWKYSKKIFLSTTLDPEGATYFLGAAMSILNGNEPQKKVEATLPCKNNAALTLQYGPDQNNQMVAYMVLNKNNLTIYFRFPTQQIQEMVDGQMVTKVIQSGLNNFAIILDRYIKETPTDQTT